MRKKIISLFSGIDCLGLGFEREFDLVLGVEKEPKACETLRVNREKFHPHLSVWETDLFNLTDAEILQHKGIAHGIIAGPPCQPFSPAKSKFDPNDARIQGLTEFKRWVHLLEPEFFLFENTDGLLQKSKREIFDQFSHSLEELGYVLSYQVVNALDYGSVQKRKRVILVGFRTDLNLTFTFPATTIPKTVADILREEPLGECLQYSAERRDIVSYVPEGGNWRQLPTEDLLKRALQGNYEKREGGMTGVYRRLSRDGYCSTLTTNPCQRNTMMCHPLEDRPLSVKESMRAQGIPEDYQIVGSVSEKYRFIGNGVPVELASAIATQIDHLLNSTNHSVPPKKEYKKTLNSNTPEPTLKGNSGQLSLF